MPAKGATQSLPAVIREVEPTTASRTSSLACEGPVWRRPPSIPLLPLTCSDRFALSCCPFNLRRVVPDPALDVRFPPTRTRTFEAGRKETSSHQHRQPCR